MLSGQKLVMLHIQKLTILLLYSGNGNQGTVDAFHVGASNAVNADYADTVNCTCCKGKIRP